MAFLSSNSLEMSLYTSESLRSITVMLPLCVYILLFEHGVFLKSLPLNNDEYALEVL